MVDHDDAVARLAVDAFAAAHGDVQHETMPADRRRRLAEQLASGVRVPAPPRRRVLAPALLAVAAMVVLVVLWPRESERAEIPRPADYQVELGGAAAVLGAESPRFHRGDVVIVRATPARATPTPTVRARWRGAAASEVEVDAATDGTVIVRVMVDRDPGRHVLELLLGDPVCAWDVAAPGCEQPSVVVEVDP